MMRFQLHALCRAKVKIHALRWGVAKIPGLRKERERLGHPPSDSNLECNGWGTVAGFGGQERLPESLH